MGQDVRRSEITLADEENKRQFLWYFTACWKSTWGRVDLKNAEKNVCIRLQGHRGHYSCLKLAILGRFKRRQTVWEDQPCYWSLIRSN